MADDFLPAAYTPASDGVAHWEEPQPGVQSHHPSSLERPLAALRRYKLLALIVFIVAVAGGVAATRLVKPEYEVRATIWVQTDQPMSDKTGPIRSDELLDSQAWVELLRSYRIADAVVRKLSLYVQPNDPADSTLFHSFGVADQFVPGSYRLHIDAVRGRWQLELASGALAGAGTAADSIGLRQGFHWLLPAGEFRRGDRDVKFAVATPRETSIELMKRLDPQLADKSNFLWLTFHDPDPRLAARTLNTWVNEYVAVAAELKKHNLVQYANILNGQLQFSETALHDAEAALETFRVNTITLPAEGGPAAPGIQDTRDPVMKSFFDQKVEFDNLRHDIDALKTTLANAQKGVVPFEGVLLIPSVAESQGADALRDSFKQLYQRQAELSAARQLYTDKYQPVQQLRDALQTLQTVTIPQQIAGLLSELEGREAQLDSRIATASQDLQAIPARTIEEMRLRRAVGVAEGLYTTLKTRYAEAQLAEASATPDVKMLDSAIAPLAPTKNTAPRLILMAVVGGLGVAIGLALLLDALDRRLRYPEQATKELGLSIAGTVPKLPKKGIDPRSPEQVFQLVESFRAIRMRTTQSVDVPMALAVSSPSPGDGKSFVSANLAMSFAEAGFNTLLVDGDTRRGALHEMFDLRRSPGLTDFLVGSAPRNAIVYATGHERLSMMPSGTRRRRSPELLASPELKKLLADLRADYDVIICDTPPFAAGIDGYAIAGAADRLLVVLRVGQTERRMAAAKLALLDRVPVQVVGAVLNAVRYDGEFQYYGYLQSYSTTDEESPAAIGSLSV
jgi:capsular exopolysaccharide synthesis family protein